MPNDPHHHFINAVTPPERAADAPAWWFLFRGNEIVVHHQDASPQAIPYRASLGDLHDLALRSNFLGTLGAAPVYAVELPKDAELPADLTTLGLRALYGAVDERLWALAGRAAQIVEWDRTHQFCGRCGTPMDHAATERAKRCPACGLTSFPRISPAVITVVEDGERILLARGPHHAPGMMALIAGFVEPGESLEETVAREIAEEVGVQVTDIRYFGSQPWPFPHSIMIGFFARYVGGEITIDPSEIEKAGWYSVHDLPKVPQRLSIARRLIDDYAARHGVTIDQP